MRKKRIIALFLIVLILTLPIYSSLVWGDFRIISATGEDGIKKNDDSGFRKTIDSTQIKLVSDSADVRWQDNPGTPLSCQTANTTTLCLFSEGESVIDNTPKIEYKFYQVDNARNPIGNKITATLYIDNAPPQIQNFNISFLNNNLTASFTVKDIGSADGCSGIKQINVYDNGLPAASYNASNNIGSCQVITGKIILPKPTSDGSNVFNIEAVDSLGNTVSSNDVTLYVDTTPPQVSDPQILRGTTTLGYISNSPINGVRVKATVSDHNLSGGIVYADLSKINIATPNLYKHIGFNCTDNGDSTYTCKTGLISVQFLAGTAALTFFTKDKAGNNATQQVSLTLAPDNNKPTVGILTENCDDTNCYINKDKNKVNIMLSKEGAGFSSNLIFLNSPTLGYVRTSNVDSCFQVSTGWQCSKNISITTSPADGAKNNLYLVNPSQDDIGNMVTPMEKELVYDDTAPSLFEGPIFRETDSGQEYVKENDLIDLSIYAAENVSGIKSAYANIHDIVNGGGWVASNSCTPDTTKGDNIYLCTWNTIQVKNGYHPNVKVKFNITDFAGNTNSRITGNVTIYGRTNETAGFWDASVKSIDPEFLDITTSKYVPGKLSVWADVELTQADADAVLLNTGLTQGKCFSTDETGNYLDNTIIYPPTPGIANPHALIVLEISKTQPLPDYLNSLSFKCTLALTSAKGNKVYPEEDHDILINVGVKDYGMDLPAEYKAKIDAFKKKLNDKKWIDSLHKFFETGQKVCNAIKTIIKVWKAVGFAIDFIGAILDGVTYTKAVAVATGAAQSGISAAMDQFMQRYGSWVCGFFDCSLVDKALSSSTNPKADYAVKFIRVYIASVSGDFNSLKLGKSATQSTENTPKWNPEQLGSNAWEASKKSIIVSALLLCVPGVIYNIEKARQIDCMYVDCAQRWTAAGFNPYTCEAMRANAYCNFVYGSIFHAIPFSGLLDAIGNFLKLFSSSPWTAAGMVWSGVCIAFNTNQASTLKTLCDATNTFTTLINFISGTINQFNFISGSDGQKDYCSIVLDDNNQ